MSYGSKEQLEEAVRMIEQVALTLEDNVDHKKSEALKRLVQACEVIEDRYKYWCEEMDTDMSLEEGQAYNEGISMEFYIESSDWHEISLALRELAK